MAVFEKTKQVREAEARRDAVREAALRLLQSSPKVHVEDVYKAIPNPAALKMSCSNAANILTIMVREKVLRKTAPSWYEIAPPPKGAKPPGKIPEGSTIKPPSLSRLMAGR